MMNKSFIAWIIIAIMTTVSIPESYAQVAAGRGSGGQAKTEKTYALTGQVFDSEGEPLAGVSVRDPKSKRGCLTDIDGKFRLIADGPGEVTIAMSYVGKKPVEMKIAPGKPARVTMHDNENAIQEVVVTGIYNRNKESFTGSSKTFDSSQLKEVGNQNVLQSLRTLDPSFTMIENNEFGSDPNRLPDIEIRGKSSIVGLKEEFGEDPNQPLFILDGFETTLQTIMDLSMDRIASVTLLKDAASTAIYGAKAANGVVVVETKAPEMGKLKVSYNGTFNISWADLTDYNLMNAAEKLEFERLSGNFESNLASTQELMQVRYNQLLANVKRGVDTYWLSEPLRTGFNQRHNLYLEGGSNELRFGIGANINKITGVMKGSDRTTGGGYIDLTYRVGNLRFINKLTVDLSDYSNPIVGFSEYASANPYYPKRNPDGSVNKWLEAPDKEYSSTTASPYVGNPLYNASLNSYDKTNGWSVRENFNMEWRPIKQLMVRGRLSLSKSTQDAEQFTSPSDTQFNEVELLKKGSYRDNRSDSFSYDADLTVTFGQNFKEHHQVNTVLGASVREYQSKFKSFEAEGFPEGEFTTPGFANQYPQSGKPGYNESKTRSANFYFNGNYSYKNKYLLDVNLRLDGTSVFGSNRQFTETWAVGLAWNLANEDFIINHTDIFNMFKIRGSIGNPGNQSFGAFNAITTYRYNNWLLNNFGTGVLIDAFGNPNLDWQKTIDLNVGLDLSMFERLHLTVDAYRKNTDPLLANIGIPLSVGISQRLENIGQQINTGISGTLRYSIIYKPKQRINWTMSLSGAYNHSEYRKIGANLDQYNRDNLTKNLTRYYDGGSPTAIWAVRSAGIDPATGKEIFITKEGKYTFLHNYADEVVVGDTRPKIEGVYGNTFYWKGFSASIYMRYSFGSKAFNSTLYQKVENISSSALTNNQDRRALYDRWQKPGDIAQFKGIREYSTSNPMSSRFVQKNNYITIESVRIAYELPYSWMSRIGFQGATVSAYMNDIARWSTMKTERGTSYPFARSVTFAVGINF
ncbi:MAG: SusC/RagA family TonB-linked outer membrane protein [Clostridiales bacterium]|nr:SusC/RagA family TonB-linked outer membrane protein [Clostridiales bacterium]